MAIFSSYNPANGERLGTYSVLSSSEIACTVERARSMAQAWAAQTVAERCAALERLRQRFAVDADSLAQTVTDEIGKPLQEAYGADVLPALNALVWLTRTAPRLLHPRRVAGRRQARLSPEPFGVVGVIGTWNYPLFLNIAPIAWALAAGNAVVWKPSELATATALAAAAHWEAIGLPVLTVTGDGTTGRALCRAGCDKIAFTGGVQTGRAILEELAARGTPSVIELSGNDALLVCGDADVELAARSAVWGRCCNAGQSCVAPQRIYVVRSVYDRFLLKARQEMQALRPGVDFGPMRTQALCCTANRMVWDAVPRGARLLAGGHALTDLPGFYYAPTLLADCHEEMLAFGRAFFGPVVTVCPVQDEAEAVVRANRGDMALGASVWTRHRRRGQEIAARLHVGLVAINDVLLPTADPALPFGGLRASGFGKQRGAGGLEEFVQWKVVTTRPTGGARRHLFPYSAATLPVLRGAIALQSARGLQEKLRAARELIQAAVRWRQEDPPPETADEP